MTIQQDTKKATVWNRIKKYFSRYQRDTLKPIGEKKNTDYVDTELKRLRGWSSVSESDKEELRKRFGKRYK